MLACPIPKLSPLTYVRGSDTFCWRKVQILYWQIKSRRLGLGPTRMWHVVYQNSRHLFWVRIFSYDVDACIMLGQGPTYFIFVYARVVLRLLNRLTLWQ